MAYNHNSNDHEHVGPVNAVMMLISFLSIFKYQMDGKECFLSW